MSEKVEPKNTKTDLGFTTVSECRLARKLKKAKPDKTYEGEYFSMKHKDFGEMKIEVHFDKQSIVTYAMKKILQTKTLSCSLFSGAVVAEICDHSKLRVKAIRRLRNKP